MIPAAKKVRNKRSLAEIIQETERISGLDIRQKSRKEAVVEWRNLAIFIAFNYGRFSKSAIGRGLNITPATVIYSLKSFRNKMITYRRYRETTEETINLLVPFLEKSLRPQIIDNTLRIDNDYLTINKVEKIEITNSKTSSMANFRGIPAEKIAEIFYNHEKQRLSILLKNGEKKIFAGSKMKEIMPEFREFLDQ